MEGPQGVVQPESDHGGHPAPVRRGKLAGHGDAGHGGRRSRGGVDLLHRLSAARAPVVHKAQVGQEDHQDRREHGDGDPGVYGQRHAAAGGLLLLGFPIPGKGAVGMGEGADQVRAHELGAGVPLLGILFDGPQHDVVERRRDGGIQFLRRGGGGRQVHQRRRDGGVPDEGNGAGEHLIQGDAGGIDIALRGHGQTLGLLRGDVVDGADHVLAGEGHGAGGDLPGDAEVGQLRLAPVGDDHVLRLYVPMDDPMGMSIGEGVQDLAADADGLLNGQMAAGALLDQLLQGLSFHILQNDIGDPVVVAYAVGPHDVLVGQLQTGPGFPFEPAQELLIVQELLPQHLDGDHLPGGHVDGAIDPGHAAAAYLANDAILVVNDIRRQSSTPPSFRTMTREMLSWLPLS